MNKTLLAVPGFYLAGFLIVLAYASKKCSQGWLLLLVLVGFTFSACNTPKGEFVILSGSENQPLEPIIQEFAKQNGYNVTFAYKGSVDIITDLQSNATTYDAVWPASGIWLTLGDSAKKVKYAQSILISPVVFGIKKSLARQLGFVGKPVKVADILAAITSGKLKFIMTSASQSNSGASAYFGFLNALLGNPEYITKEDLHKPALKTQIRKLLGGVNRSSGSSGWLKDLFLKGGYDAMVNYEALIIEANQQLVKEAKEPLYLVYPVDGLVIADSQLGYVDNGDSKKEAFFKKLQAYLLGEKVQGELLKLGRRTGFGGELQNAPTDVFNPDWGIDVHKVLSPVKLPKADVILEAINLYQTVFRKPSLTVFCLDYSGSMEGEGVGEVKKAMQILLDQASAKKYMLQTSADDKIIVIPFSDSCLAQWEVDGDKKESMDSLLNNIEHFTAKGSTDIYSPVMKGLDEINAIGFDKYSAAVILMTDGQSNIGKKFEEFKAYWQQLGKDIPVFAITFGEASEDQLGEITGLARGTVFDGKNDLVTAFRKAKGYN
jgi:Ca-activated chloride channel family protein